MSDLTDTTTTTTEDETPLPSVADVMQSLQNLEDETATADAEALSVALTLDEAVERIEDNSQLAEGKSWADVVETVKVAALSVVAFVVNLSRVRYEAGKALGEAYASVRLPNGIPDWGGKSSAAGIIRKYALDAAMDRIADATQTERDNERNAIVKQYERNHQERLIRDYVARTTVQTVPGSEGEPILMFPDGAGSIPPESIPLFNAYVREQYIQSGVGIRKMPADYRTTEDREALRTNGGPGQGQSSSLEVARKGLTALRGDEKVPAVAVQYRATVILEAVSDLVRDVEAHKVEMHGKGETVAEVLGRVSSLSDYAARLISYPATVKADDAEAAATCYFDADRDDPNRDGSIWS